MRHLLHRIALAAPLLVAMPLASAAQPDDLHRLSPERLKEIKAQKSAYLTTKLGLTPEEAQRFWPVYNAYDEQREALRRKMLDVLGEGRDAGPGLTEQQAAALLEKAMANRQQEIDLEREYAGQFKKSIGAVKTLQLRKAEMDFQREMLRRIRDRKEDRNGGSVPPSRYLYRSAPIFGRPNSRSQAYSSVPSVEWLWTMWR